MSCSPFQIRPNATAGHGARPRKETRVKITLPFRRAAARRKARQVRRKIASARRIVVETDAMLARLPRKGTP